MEGKQVVPCVDWLEKIKAALDSRTDPDLVIMARTDALAVIGIDEALERAQLAHEAGADLLFVEAPTDVEQMKRIVRTLPLRRRTLRKNPSSVWSTSISWLRLHARSIL